MNDIRIDHSRSAQATILPALPAATISPARDKIDSLRKILAVLRRRWLPFIGVFLFVVGGTAWFTWRQTPSYTATTNLVVNSRLLNISTKDKDVLPVVPTQDGAVDTEIQILLSPEVLERTVRSLNLTQKEPFAAALVTTPAINRIGAAAGMVKSHLEVSRPGATNVVAISYTSPDPALAKAVADEIARQYLRVKTDTRLQAASSVDEGLTQQLDMLRGKVEQAEAKVAQYKSANNLLSSAGVTLSEQEISIYKQQQAAARANLAEEQARLRTAQTQLRSGSSGDDVGEALNSQVVEQLRTQRSTLSAKLADLKSRYRPQHPDVVNAEHQLADVDAAIQAEIGRVISNLEARTQVAGQRAAAASDIAASATGALASNNAASVRLNELERQAEAYRSNYAAMLDRQNAISSQAMIADEDARIFSPAILPRLPSSPNKLLNMATGAMLGLILASLVTWLLQMFDRGIVTSTDAETRLGLAHLANIPSIRSIAAGPDRAIPAERFAVDRPMSIYAESLRSLRLALMRSRHGQPVSLIGITSSCPGEGKSTLALSLARTAALAGDRALLIDGDIRRPSIAQFAGFTAELGFLDILSGHVPLSRAIVQDPLTKLHILPTPIRAFTPHESFRGEAMQRLLAQVRAEYDVVVIDTAPALAASDARIILDQCDAVVIAVRWKKTLLPMVQAALRKMRTLHIVPVGAVLTQVDMKAVSAYGYGDVDFNYRAYKGYYA